MYKASSLHRELFSISNLRAQQQLIWLKIDFSTKKVLCRTSDWILTQSLEFFSFFFPPCVPEHNHSMASTERDFYSNSPTRSLSSGFRACCYVLTTVSRRRRCRRLRSSITLCAFLAVAIEKKKSLSILIESDRDEYAKLNWKFDLIELALSCSLCAHNSNDDDYEFSTNENGKLEKEIHFTLRPIGGPLPGFHSIIHVVWWRKKNLVKKIVIEKVM